MNWLIIQGCDHTKNIGNSNEKRLAPRVILCSFTSYFTDYICAVFELQPNAIEVGRGVQKLLPGREIILDAPIKINPGFLNSVKRPNFKTVL